MKLYYPKFHYNSEYRGHLFPLLKAYIKPNSYTSAQRLKDYGVKESDFSIVDKPNNADCILLTMSWLYYTNTNQLPLAIDFIKSMNKLGFKVWLNIPGDIGINIPVNLKVNVLVQQGYKYKSKGNIYCYPSFIEDSLKLYKKSSTPSTREYKLKPSIGFCGHATSSLLQASLTISKTAIKNICYYLYLKPYLPHKLISSVYMRSKILKLFSKSNQINTNFIKRTSYRAGLKYNVNKQNHQTTKDFFKNIDNSDYTLCYRGAGNFSIRLYQTLAMGRIPVFVNTDCILPLENIIDWKNHVVWIEEQEISKISEILIKFHSNLDDKLLNQLYKENREFWEKKLRLGPFFVEMLKNIDSKV